MTGPPSSSPWGVPKARPVLEFALVVVAGLERRRGRAAAWWGGGSWRSGPWTFGSELIANVVRVDYSTHVAAPANRQLRPHVLALLASSRRRLGGPIVRRLLRESLNAGHRHGSPNAWAATESPCLADYILQGQFGQEAVRSRGEQLGRTSTSRVGPYSTDDLGSRLTLIVTASAISMSLRFERRASSRSISNAR